ncbi:hypothetical protein [Catenuloplanes atrovinosus]|uniref:META domain-containing protein n=1 Tax=Catenuloplanes atrovinosus TaxID=137266 RepID=A0AAE3YSZ5_9ACTN|nr:hypothetical protein [Catenuloplanes atrovinosus]MDR7279095.1 hypothetical protein [Catenuloplanes atrovinosus]
MRRLPYLGMLLVLPVAACAAPGESPSAGAPSAGAPPAFTSRAEAVAAAWPAVEAATPAWTTGFVPLQGLLIAPAGLSVEQRQAFDAGWFTLTGTLPSDTPSGQVTYASAVERTPLISAAEAYRLIDQGDPPPCEPAGGKRSPGPASGGGVSGVAPGSTGGATGSTGGATGPDGGSSDGGREPAAPGPDSPVSAADSGCAKLPVTGATLGTVPLRTSRGDATVPAWLFTVGGVPGPVARVAVAAGDTAPVPSPSLAPPEAGNAANLKGAQSLVRVAGTTIDYRLGVGACDEQITPLAYETDEVIVLGGTATRSAEMCTEQLVLQPVTVTLAAPAGDRLVLDAQTGQPVILTP